MLKFQNKGGSIMAWKNLKTAIAISFLLMVISLVSGCGKKEKPSVSENDIEEAAQQIISQQVADKADRLKSEVQLDKQEHTDQETENKLKTLRTIRESKEKANEKMDHFEYETDRLQAAIEDLLRS